MLVPQTAGESRYGYSTETAFSVVVVGFQVLAPVGVLFKVQLRFPLGDLAATPRTALIGELTRVAVFGRQRTAMAAGTCQEPLPPGRVH